jgi:hypothetical protein
MGLSGAEHAFVSVFPGGAARLTFLFAAFAAIIQVSIKQAKFIYCTRA